MAGRPAKAIILHSTIGHTTWGQVTITHRVFLCGRILMVILSNDVIDVSGVRNEPRQRAADSMPLVPAALHGTS